MQRATAWIWCMYNVAHAQWPLYRTGKGCLQHVSQALLTCWTSIVEVTWRVASQLPDTDNNHTSCYTSSILWFCCWELAAHLIWWAINGSVSCGWELHTTMPLHMYIELEYLIPPARQLGSSIPCCQAFCLIYTILYYLPYLHFRYFLEGGRPSILWFCMWLRAAHHHHAVVFYQSSQLLQTAREFPLLSGFLL